MARISDAERVQRLYAIDNYNKDGLSDHAIAEEMGVSIEVVKRLQNYLTNLRKADITPEEISEKRAELYLELTEASAEAKALFEKYKTPSACKLCDGIGVFISKSKEGNEVKSLCSICKGAGELMSTLDANRFFKSWLDAIEKKAKLYGLDTMRSESILQQFNFHSDKYVPDTKISGKARELSEKLVKKLKEEHEESRRGQ